MGVLQVCWKSSDTLNVARVAIGAGRLDSSRQEECPGGLDSRRVDLVFAGAAWLRTGRFSDARDDDFDRTLIGIPEDWRDYFTWRQQTWLAQDRCPNPGVYEVEESHWLPRVDPDKRWVCKHYLIESSDDFVEILALAFHWTERIWPCSTEFGSMKFEDVPGQNPVVAEGASDDWNKYRDSVALEIAGPS